MFLRSLELVCGSNAEKLEAVGCCQAEAVGHLGGILEEQNAKRSVDGGGLLVRFRRVGWWRRRSRQELRTAAVFDTL